ncbi:Retrovirus-related Pol polyprotein from transposon, partial [Tetrabaena socialis]
YNRLLYGLRNATSHFQRVMDTHIREWGLQDFVVCYVDDLLIFSRTAAEHVEHLARLFAMLRTIGIKLHPEKTLFAADAVEFLGHMVSRAGLKPTQARIAAFMALRPPSSLTECQRILGMFGYYRGYIDHSSQNKSTLWGPQQRAFDAIKQEFAEEGCILRRVDPKRPLILHTDFSGSGISSVLGQLDNDSREYMVACVSRTLNVHEQRYGACKGELLAVVWAVQTLRPYLHGWPFTLVTDHSPLEWLMTQQDLTGQAARWALILQGYDFTVVHRPGVMNQNADALSRDPTPSAHDSTGARLDHASDPMPPPPRPGSAPPAAAIALVSTCWRARAGSAQLANVLCTTPTTSHAFLPAQPWVLASVRRVGCLHLARAGTAPACVPDGAELLAGHAGSITNADDYQPPAADPAVRTAAALVSSLRATLRLLQPEPRLPLRIASAHGPTSGINTSLRHHAFFAAAEADGVALLEVPGGLAVGLQVCLRLGVKVRWYVSLEQQPDVCAGLRRLIPALARAHPLCLQLAAWHGDVGGTTLVPGATAVARLDSLPLRQGGQWLVVGGWGWEAPPVEAARLAPPGPPVSPLRTAMVVPRWQAAAPTGPWRASPLPSLAAAAPPVEAARLAPPGPPVSPLRTAMVVPRWQAAALTGPWRASPLSSLAAAAPPVEAARLAPPGPPVSPLRTAMVVPRWQAAALTGPWRASPLPSLAAAAPPVEAARLAPPGPPLLQAAMVVPQWHAAASMGPWRASPLPSLAAAAPQAEAARLAPPGLPVPPLQAATVVPRWQAAVLTGPWRASPLPSLAAAVLPAEAARLAPPGPPVLPLQAAMVVPRWQAAAPTGPWRARPLPSLAAAAPSAEAARLAPPGPPAAMVVPQWHAAAPMGPWRASPLPSLAAAAPQAEAARLAPPGPLALQLACRPPPAHAAGAAVAAATGNAIARPRPRHSAPLAVAAQQAQPRPSAQLLLRVVAAPPRAALVVAAQQHTREEEIPLCGTECHLGSDARYLNLFHERSPDEQPFSLEKLDVRVLPSGPPVLVVTRSAALAELIRTADEHETPASLAALGLDAEDLATIRLFCASHRVAAATAPAVRRWEERGTEHATAPHPWGLAAVRLHESWQEALDLAQGRLDRVEGLSQAGLDWFDEAWGPIRVVKALPCLCRPVYSLPVGAGETALGRGRQPVSYSQCWPPAHLPQPGPPSPRPLAGPVPLPDAPAHVADVGGSDGGSSDGGSGGSCERRSDSGSGSDGGEEAGWGDVRLVNYYRRFLPQLPAPPSPRAVAVPRAAPPVDAAASGADSPAGSTSPEGHRELPPDPRFVRQPGGWTLCERADTPAAVRAQLLELVAVHDTQPAGLFARSLGVLTGYTGSCPAAEINLTHERGIFQHPRRHSPGEYAVMDEKCNALLAAGLIEKAPDGCRYAMNSTMPGKKDEEG